MSDGNGNTFREYGCITDAHLLKDSLFFHDVCRQRIVISSRVCVRAILLFSSWEYFAVEYALMMFVLINRHIRRLFKLKRGKSKIKTLLNASQFTLKFLLLQFIVASCHSLRQFTTSQAKAKTCCVSYRRRSEMSTFYEEILPFSVMRLYGKNQ